MVAHVHLKRAIIVFDGKKYCSITGLKLYCQKRISPSNETFMYHSEIHLVIAISVVTDSSSNQLNRTDIFAYQYNIFSISLPVISFLW